MTNLNVILSQVRGLVTKAKIAALTLNGKVFEFDVNLTDGDGHSNGELMVHHGLFSRPPLGTTAVILFPRGDKNLGIAVATRGKTPPAKVLSDAEAAFYTASGDFMMLDGKGGAVINLAAMMSVVATSLKGKFSGNVSIDASGLTLNVSGNATIKAASATIDAPNVTLTGQSLAAAAADVTCLSVAASASIAAPAISVDGTTIAAGGLAGGLAMQAPLAATNISDSVGSLAALRAEFAGHTHTTPNGPSGPPITH